MSLKVTCFYCGAKKSVLPGTLVKLSCDQCSSSRVVLAGTAVFRCGLCGKQFEMPGGEQVMAYHDVDHCKGRALVLVDYE